VISAPAAASSVARITADVLLPAPPFGDAKTTVGMHDPQTDGLLSVDGKLTIDE